MPAALDFTKEKTVSFAGKTLSCTCGKSHSAGVEHIYIGENALGMLCPTLSAIAPCGKVLVLHGGGAETSAVADTLGMGGYQPVLLTVPPHAPAAQLACFAEVPEDVRAAVTVGGGSAAQLGKYYASARGLRRVAVMTSPDDDGLFSSAARLLAGGLPAAFAADAPFAVLCDLNLTRLAGGTAMAAAFGHITAKLCALIDLFFMNALRGAPLCLETVRLAVQAADLASAAAQHAATRRDDACDILCDAMLRVSLCDAFTEGGLWGGEHQLSAALALMAQKQKLPWLTPGEAELLAASALLPLYRHYFSEPFSDTLLPVDKARHIDALCALTGAEASAAVRRMASFRLDPAGLRPDAHKIDLYRSDLLRRCDTVCVRLPEAERLMKRLYPDGGYAAARTFETLDLRAALALAAAAAPRGTVLSHMRNQGLFEQYLPAAVV